MQKGSFIWGFVENKYRSIDKRVDRIWIVILLIAAVILFTINLGVLPLRDWDEGTIAQVARELGRGSASDMRWLFPTLGGEPYHNKPPLMHLMIAWAYSLGGINEWTTRLPGAILTALTVPFLYSIGREIFHQRICAIYSALVYLTMLPVVRHGRLAMLDGAAVFFFMVMLLCVLRSRRDLRYCLGVGIGFALICLTKSILGVLLGAVAMIFLFWDTPRLLKSKYMWTGIFIGIIPLAFWYGAQWWNYGDTFTSKGIMNQSLSRIWTSVEEHDGPPWYYLLEICKYTWPWLIFLPASLRFTWENRNLSWAKLVLVWLCVYLLAISVMGTKLPWYVFPIYPSIALAIGAKLGEVENLPLLTPLPKLWLVMLSLLAVISAVASTYFSWSSTPSSELQLIFAAFSVTMALAALRAQRGDRQFIKVILWGTYVSLVLFVKSNYWVWELNEDYAVKPVVQMVIQANPGVSPIYISSTNHRPSLDFYSDGTIKTASPDDLKYYWQHDQKPYFLLDEDALKTLPLDSVEEIAKQEGWTLVTKNTTPAKK
ncbi:glycosyltransferase family 39 protein [Plectonema cf. radiosum LEGE 06105]|uniref:Glycosyltransferase family 39 protein n=1 Tax=Plectonema cf. radiosum LEGE 06105 TaxID=945769 RepID=A0A8J7F253_9CYAN|nr:glycosyltransferase family 39 protein [Plectonema radiosum]MBE9211580.1 glycosyltransferase family 39 protein [Plectonema cf. radiosum LEGE 06105]